MMESCQVLFSRYVIRSDSVVAVVQDVEFLSFLIHHQHTFPVEARRNIL